MQICEWYKYTKLTTLNEIIANKELILKQKLPVKICRISVNVVETDYSTWGIVKAVQYGITKRVIELVEPSDPQLAGYDVNQLDDEDVSLLHWAAINNRLAIARYLLSKGAIIDRPGGHLAATPLHWAIRQSHLSMVHFLMQRGADPTFMDNTGLGCFHVAIQMGNVPIIVYLLSHGINVDTRDGNGLTPLMIACMHVRSVDIFRLLISYGANLRLTDSHGNTAAHYSVQFANFQAVVQLDKGDIDWNALNDENKTPYEVRVVPWLTDRVKQMANVQSIMNSSHRFSRLGLSMLHYSPVWRQRITIMLPPLILITCGLLINWDIPSTLYHLNFADQSSKISSWIIYSTKFLLLLLLSFTARFIIDRFSDHKSQAVMLFSLATSTKLLLTTTYLFHITLRTPNHWVLHFWFLFFITMLWTTFILCCTKNPGYVDEIIKKECQQDTIAQLLDEVLNNTNDLTLANNNQEESSSSTLSINPLQRFCTTCFIRKPLRSKHCSTCDRCVARFDHHCPWIYNCVGMKNHFYFIIYLLSTSVSCNLFMLGTIVYWQNEFSCLPNTPLTSGKTGIYVEFNTNNNNHINNNNNNNNNNKSLSNEKFHHSTNYNRPYDHGIWRNLLDLIGLPGFIINSNKSVDWRQIYQIEQLNNQYPIYTTPTNTTPTTTNTTTTNNNNDVDKKLLDWSI
ncbi:palmitoyltransferase ZDHHC13/17 [Schistosoma bovis]|uniref:Palmitoyltransferase n=1 Tax=Schistosoma bovis TaxID=6184 RepID=A0A430QGC2_SCHBO|nr:palmitoyltransferase ZDHHC13/17 [Schistosoma bovis]